MTGKRSQLPNLKQRPNQAVYQFIRGATSGVLTGGGMGIVACCLGNALSGAMLVYADWNQFPHPLGAMLISALYLGCLGFPIGAVIAFPSSLLMGGIISCYQRPPNQRRPFAFTCMVVVFCILETLNSWSGTVHPNIPAIPGRWFQHLITLTGVTIGLVYWPSPHPDHHRFRKSPRPQKRD